MKILFKYSLLAFALSSSLIACSTKSEQQLPYIGEPTINETTVDGKKVIDTVYHTIPTFSFLNQDSVFITEKNFDNKIYLANFFFTHCPSICPTMQRNMLKVYEKYKGDERISFLSHSIDFKYDAPSVLKAYAQKLGVEGSQWQFVTGSKKDIYGMADAYLVYTKEDADVPGGYDHQGYLMLIDQDRHIRGAYDGTNDEQVAQLLKDLEIILKAN